MTAQQTFDSFGGNFIQRMKARMEGIDRPDPRKPMERSRHIVRTNRFDDKVWGVARESEPVDELINDLSLGNEFETDGARPAFDPSPELVEGVFQTFYKAAPELKRKREITKEAYPARRILEEIMKNPKLQDLQDLTASDPLTSAIAVDSMGDDLREILERVGQAGGEGFAQQGGGGGGQGEGGGQGQAGGNAAAKKQKSQGESGEGEGGGGSQQQSGGHTNQTDSEQGSSGQGGGNGEGTMNDEDLSEDVENDDFDPESEDADNQEEKDWQDAFDKLLDDLDLDRMANRALEKAQKDVEELENLRKGIGLEDGEWRTMDPTERLKLAEQLRTPHMQELSKIIGQMKRFALGVRATRIIDVPHEPYDVTTGDDIMNALRMQLGLLGTKETTYEFYRRMIDKELLVYKKRGTEEVGKGPIVIAIDKSGSMHGEPFMWAMAVAEALRRFAADEERDYYAMFFGSNNDRNRFDFPKGTGPFEKVLTFLSVEANGGTQFDGVLTEALERAVLGFDKEGKPKADIVFITDGAAYLDDEWIANFNKEKERVGVRMYSVYIGGAYDMSYATGPESLLSKVSDLVIPVSELEPEAASDIFARV